MVFVVRGLHDLSQKRDAPLSRWFIDVTKAYDPVDRTLSWTVLARCGVPSRTFAVTHQLHDGMRARVRSDYGECSNMFDVEWGLPKRVCA